MSRMLILFDIDGTLLLSKKAGIRAMEEAGRLLYCDSFSSEVEFAGRMDPLIWVSLMERNGLEASPERHDEFRETYFQCLSRRFEQEATSTLLIGVEPLVHQLAQCNGCVLGLATGNYRKTGRLKIAQAGLDPDIFTITAWADGADHRRDLPRIAMEQYQQKFSQQIDPGEVVIIGDTPYDIDCARFNGCRSLGVATGPSYEREDLIEAGADLVVDNLEDTATILDWLLKSAPTQAE